MKVTIFGDSHIASLRAGASVLADGHDATIWGSHGHNWLDPAIAEEAGGIRFSAHRVKNMRPLDLLLRPEGRLYLSSPLHTSPYIRHATWRRFCPWNVHEAHPELQPVSDDAILIWVDRAVAARMKFLTLLRDKGFDIRALEAPRPLERAPAVLGMHPDVVRGVDELCRTHIMARLAEIGVPVVTVPEETVIDGFTPEAFSSAVPNDTHHGNDGYGQLMMQRIRADLERA